jgi:hypothetical protein
MIEPSPKPTVIVLAGCNGAGKKCVRDLIMAEERKRSLAEMLDDKELIAEALRKGVHDELLSHARAGNSVAVSENGKIVWLTPDEIYRRLGCPIPPESKAS